MEYSKGTYKIGAVVVAFNPSEQLLHDCLVSLLRQVDCVCVVDNSLTDNGDSMSSYSGYGDKLRYIPLRCNRGIAAAQNIGINYFRENAYDFVIFSDQDSTSSDTLIRSLVEAYFVISEVADISCIGPLPINRKTNKPYLYDRCIIDRCELSGVRYFKMHSIISSYSLVSVANFSEVGLMDEKLFIDFVDQQWCWRAAAYNNKVCVLLPDVTIAHEQGVSSTFLGHAISLSTPFRIYYQTRNLLWLCRKDYAPASWKKMNLKKLVVKFFYYSVFPKQRMRYCKRMLKGVVDGIFSPI